MESAHANRRIVVMESRTSTLVLTGRATSANAHRARNIRCNYGAATARNPAEDERQRTGPWRKHKAGQFRAWYPSQLYCWSSAGRSPLIKRKSLLRDALITGAARNRGIKKGFVFTRLGLDYQPCRKPEFFFGATVTRYGGASFAPSSVPRRIALVVDSGTE